MSTEKNMNVTTTSWDAAIIDLNNAIRENTENVPAALEVAQQALKVENDARVSARIEKLLDLYSQAPVDFWTEYVNATTVEVLRLVQDPKSKEYSAIPASKYVSFGRIEKAYRAKDDKNVTLAASPKVYRMISYFVDNLGKIIAGDLSNDDKDAKKVIAPTFNYNIKAKDPNKVTTPADRKELDFSGTSIGAMTDQLNHIVNAMFPADFVAPLRKADFRAIKQFATGNKLRSAKLSNEAAFLENFFEAVRVRKNDLEYTMTSGATCHRVKTEESKNQH